MNDGLLEFIVFIIVVGILAFLDTYIGKSKNNKYSTGTVTPSDDSTDRTWKTYSGKLMYLPKNLKIDYMNSEEWDNLKELRLVMASYCCEACGNKYSLHLHHITYRRLTREDLDDVRILCASCHSRLHDMLGYDRSTKYPIHYL